MANISRPVDTSAPYASGNQNGVCAPTLACLVSAETDVCQMEVRGTTSLSGGHSSHVECISWHPTHPELLCSASRKDMKVAFWDVRRASQPPLRSQNRQ